MRGFIHIFPFVNFHSTWIHIKIREIGLHTHRELHCPQSCSVCSSVWRTGLSFLSNHWSMIPRGPVRPAWNRHKAVCRFARSAVKLAFGQGCVYHVTVLAMQSMVQVKGPQQAVLLIDGYNIMLQWLEEPRQRRLKKVSGGNFEVIREAFLRDVSAYSSRELRVMVAFDAMGNAHSPPIARSAIVYARRRGSAIPVNVKPLRSRKAALAKLLKGQSRECQADQSLLSSASRELCSTACPLPRL